MMVIFMVGSCLLIFPSVEAVSRPHRAGCNFRVVRDIMRRACAYHSSEQALLTGPNHESGLSTGNSNSNEINRSSSLSSSMMMDDQEYHHEHVSGGRIKKEIELLYIRRILKECCPNEGCPPLSKFCN